MREVRTSPRPTASPCSPQGELPGSITHRDGQARPSAPRATRRESLSEMIFRRGRRPYAVTMSEPRRKVGRPSKGPRRTFGVSVPEPLGSNIEKCRDLTGTPMGELIVEVLMRHADELDPDLLDLSGAQPRFNLEQDKEIA